MRKGKVLNMQESIVNESTAGAPAGGSRQPGWPWPQYSRWEPARRPVGADR